MEYEFESEATRNQMKKVEEARYAYHRALLDLEAAIQKDERDLVLTRKNK